MKKILSIITLLFVVLGIAAQEMQVKLYFKSDVEATDDNDNVISLSGVLTMPANALDSIVYVLKDIDNLEFVDLGTGDGVLWATINYGATADNPAGKLLPWANIGEVYEKWGKPYDRYVQTPTIDHLKNLRNNCVWERVGEGDSFKGFNVFKKKADGEADRNVFIFLPVTGYMDPETGNDINKPKRGYYWSSSAKENYSNEARAMQFAIDDDKGDIGVNNQHPRVYSYAIRPVLGGPVVSASVNISLEYSNRIATFSVSASVEGEDAELGDYGVEYRMSGTNEWLSKSCNSQGIAQVSNLNPGAYEYRGYATIKGLTEKFYSHESEFPTFDVPTVTAKVNSVEFLDYKNRIARFKIIVSVDGDGEIGNYGIEYRLKPDGTSLSREHSSSDPNIVELTSPAPGTYEFRGYASLKGSNERTYSEYKEFTIPENTLFLKAEIVEGSLKYNSVTIRVYPEADDVNAFQYSSWGVYIDENRDKVASPTSPTSGLTLNQGSGTLSTMGSEIRLQLSPEHTYYFCAYASINGEDKFSDVSEPFTTPNKPEYVEPDPVDLGLYSGTKWASFNLGAEDIYDAGNYYGWGDPTGTVVELSSGYYAPEIMEATDISKGNYVNYDIVHVKLQGDWHMPDTTQLRELIDNCHFNYVQNYSNHVGLNGYVVTGPNGNTIFMPAASYATAYNDEWQPKTEINTGAYYWSSVLDGDLQAFYAKLGNGRGNGTISKNSKNMGYLIRPVIPGSGNQQPVTTDDPLKPKDERASDGSIIPQAGIDMGMRTVYWSCWNLGATETTGTNSRGAHYAWGEIQGEKSLYTQATYTEGYGNQLGYEINNYTGTVGSDHDAATYLWGDGWRMPTQDEISQLVTECSWSYDEVEGVPGIRFTDDKLDEHYPITNNSIFFPFDPYRDDEISVDGLVCGYWTSSCWNDGDLGQKKVFAAYLQLLKRSPTDPVIELNGVKGFYRYGGLLIRPVKDLPASTRQAREAYHREMESRRNPNK